MQMHPERKERDQYDHWNAQSNAITTAADTNKERDLHGHRNTQSNAITIATYTQSNAWPLKHTKQRDYHGFYTQKEHDYYGH